MNTIIKNTLIKIVKIVSGLFKDDSKKASIYTWFSKILINKENSVIYDSEDKLFWLKNQDNYLYAENEPTFNFNYKKLESDANRICCKNYRPQTGDIIIDIGAGVGTELVYFYNQVKKSGKIYSIEASPATFRKLNLLSHKNNFTNSLCYNLAIADKNGEVWIEEIEAHEKAKINNAKSGTSVKCITLDEFVVIEKLNKINFLKVNIEGAEELMLDGMVNSINNIDNIAISCHDFLYESNNNKIRNKVIQFLKFNGFIVLENNTGHKVVDSWVYGRRII